jgi:hypothetical protein
VTKSKVGSPSGYVSCIVAGGTDLCLKRSVVRLVWFVYHVYYVLSVGLAHVLRRNHSVVQMYGTPVTER